MRYIHKTAGVDAVIWDGARTFLESRWVLESMVSGKIVMRGDTAFIKTLSGTREVKLGEWIVKGRRDELYVYTREEFEREFEPETRTFSIGELAKMVSDLSASGQIALIELISKNNSAKLKETA